MRSLENGWIPDAQRCPSPNCDDRPVECDINLLVIHNISLPPGQFGDSWIADLFLNRLDTDAHPYFSEISDLRVSSHLLIRRDGTLIQFVPLDKRAWHAGKSSFMNTDNCNDFSIGIELEGTDETPFTQAQYDQLVIATKQIQRLYPAITNQRIVGHSDIAPGRKTDPGPFFDWDLYRNSLTNA